MESLIAFSIVGIFLALTWATAAFLLQKGREQTLRTRAHFLAVEGVEIVKQIRQTAVNKDRQNGFRDAIGSRDGEYVIERNGAAFFLKEGQNESIEMPESPSAFYCRTLFFSGEDPALRMLRVQVRWGDAADCAFGEETLEYRTYLAQYNPS